MEFVEPTATVDGASRSSDRPLLRVYADWILAVTLVVVGLTFLLTARQTPSYSSTARVMIEPRIFPGTGPAQEADTATEQAVASSSVVRSMAAEALHLPPSEMAKGVSVSAPADAKVLDISYAYRSAAEAQRRAGGLAQAYVDYLNSQGIRQPGSVYLRPPPSGLVQASVINPATLPAGPSSPKLVMNLTIATVVGLALGLGSAVIRDRLDRRLRGTGDLSQHAGMSVLAMIPSFGRRRSGHPVTMQPGSAAAEAFRYLRARVQQALLRQGRGTLLVTSAKPGEGRTTTAVNLALAFAASGSRVVLMEADLRGERLATQFGLPEDTVGLTTLLTERVPIASALQETDVPGLRLLTQGPPVPAPGDLLAGHWLPRLMAGLLGTAADLVIIDAPPILSKADAVSLLRVSDATLLVVDGQRTSRRLVADAAHEIGWAGGMAVAAVVNTVPRRVRRRPIPLWRPFTTSLKSAGPAADGEIETIPAPHE